MKKTIFFLLGLGLLSQAGAKISQKELTEGEYEIVIIQKGDTLWDLAGKYIGKCYKWPEFEAYNKFTDPHWIYPGEKLAIGIKDGKLFMKKAREVEQELKEELERKNREIAMLKEEIERLKGIAGKEVIISDEEERKRLEKDVGGLRAETEALRREIDELARKLLKAEELIETKDQILSFEKQKGEKIEEALKQTQQAKETIAKEEKTQRRYKEILAISAFVGVILFNSLK